METKQYGHLVTAPSLFTIGVLSFFLLVLIVTIDIIATGGSLGIVGGIVLVIVLNIASWLLGPRVMEFVIRLVYDIEWYNIHDYKAHVNYDIAAFTQDVCDKNGLDYPKVGVVKDDTPFAYTFGSDHWNARIVYSEGCQEYMDKKEFKAVMAHEIGHIRNRDFILMSLVMAILQLIYVIFMYARFASRRASGRAKSALAWVAVASFIFYKVGRFIYYYLSRSREYKADKFSVQYTSSSALSSALVKISYGIVETQQTEGHEIEHDDEEEKSEEGSGPRVLKTKDVRDMKENVISPMNIVSLSGDHPLGKLFSNDSMDRIRHAVLYDAYSPWARVLEKFSTHPLTGNRIKTMEQHSTRDKLVNVEHLAETESRKIREMRSVFYTDLKVLAAKYVGAIIGIIAAITLVMIGTGNLFTYAALPIFGYTIGKLFEFNRRFPSDTPDQERVGNLYLDVTASPVKGRRVTLQGDVMGKYPPGHKFTPHLSLIDGTGWVITQFKSRLGPIGEFWKGWQSTDKHVDADAEITGWYYRSGSNNRILQHDVQTSAGSFTSYPRFWFIGKLALLGGLGIVLLTAGGV